MMQLPSGKHRRFLTSVCCLLCSTLAVASKPTAAKTMLPGFLRSNKTQLVNSSAEIDYQFKIMSLVPDGTRVEAGDTLIKLQGVHWDEWEQRERNELDRSRLTMERDLQTAENDLRSLQDNLAQQEREMSILQVEQGRALSGVSAPRSDMSARQQEIQNLDIEQREQIIRLTREKIERKQIIVDVSRNLVRETTRQLELLKANYAAARSKAEIKAERGGVVLLRRSRWRQTKPKEGESVYRGEDLLAVVDERDLFVEAYVRESVWSQLSINCPVTVRILGQKELTVAGTISTLGKMVMPVGTWDQTLPENSPLRELRAFKAVVQLESVPSEAKPDGEVQVIVSSCATKGGTP